MTESIDWPRYCREEPDKLYKNREVLLKTIIPPEDVELEGLSKEIWDNFEENKQTILQFTNKINLWNRLNEEIKSEFPKYGLFMAGSSMNGFGLKNSDVDFSFLTKDKDSLILKDCLEKLYNHLKTLNYVNNIELIKAKIPLIKFLTNERSLTVDINRNGTVNIRNSHLMYHYSQIDWRVRPLVVVIKLWAKNHKIIDARYSSLCSYPLVLMVINFLQCGVKPAVLPSLQALLEDNFNNKDDVQSINFTEKIHFLEESFTTLNPRNHQSLEELLLEFFKYYENFEFSKYVISVRKGNAILRSAYTSESIYTPEVGDLTTKSCQYISTKGKMFIEEPFTLVNVGETVYKNGVYKKIKNGFKTSHKELRTTGKLSSFLLKKGRKSTYQGHGVAQISSGIKKKKKNPLIKQKFHLV